MAAALLYGIADLLTSPDHAPGCLILNNALPICDDHPFRAEWAEGRSAIRNALAERFREDRESGLAFPEAWDPSDTARLIVSMIWGIAIEVHSGASAPDVQRMISHFLATWPEP